MTPWIPEKTPKIGIVICSFGGDLKNGLQLQLGDVVQITQRNVSQPEWFYGFKLDEPLIHGLFPSNFVVIKDKRKSKIPNANEVLLTDKFIGELTDVIREWGELWKQLFIKSHLELVTEMKDLLHEVIHLRRQLLSGRLPTSEQKALVKKVNINVDKGNKLLDLDIIIRDNRGLEIDPFSVGPMSLLRDHQASKSHEGHRDTDNLYLSHSHSLLVCIHSIECTEQVQILGALYDGVEHSYITENYMINWCGDNSTSSISPPICAIYNRLDNRDIHRRKIFLVFQVVRVGAMHKRIDERRSTKEIRRPYGVGVLDVTAALASKIKTVDWEDAEREFISFTLASNENDFLDTLVRKTIALPSREHGRIDLIFSRDSKKSGLSVSYHGFHGEDPAPASAVYVSKMGLPEIIMPGDIYNHIYVTINQGDFERGPLKTSNKNTEVSLTVCKNDNGEPMANAIRMGVGSNCKPLTEFKSLVYYQIKQPIWRETVKIEIPLAAFYGTHLRFTFRHRSSGEGKDKQEKPFSLAFLKLIEDGGTTLKDGLHDMLLYRFDRHSDDPQAYLAQHSTLEQQQNSDPKARTQGPIATGNLTLCRDTLNIRTVVCSTKITQNANLVGLLKWKQSKYRLKNIIEMFMQVKEEEIVKFLQDTLDALFGIVLGRDRIDPDSGDDENDCNELVFDALVYIMGLVVDKQYQRFRPVLDAYITHDFAATTIHVVLLEVLNRRLDVATDGIKQLKTMKSLEYMFKFIVHSRKLMSVESVGSIGKENFDMSVVNVFTSIQRILSDPSDGLVALQGTALRYLPVVVGFVSQVLDGNTLVQLVRDILIGMLPDHLVKQKLQFIQELLNCKVSAIPACRQIFLPCVLNQTAMLLRKRQELDTCYQLLSDLFKLLCQDDWQCDDVDINLMVHYLFDPLLYVILKTYEFKTLEYEYVVCLIALLRLINEKHYTNYIREQKVLEFISQIFHVFHILCTKNDIYSDKGTWTTLILLQNAVLIKILRFISGSLAVYFLDAAGFNKPIWANFFRLSVAFITQPCLQLENFRIYKRKKIIHYYGDMRLGFANKISEVWYTLGAHKILFIPELVGCFLEISLVGEPEVRAITLPILYDMMEVEWAKHLSFHGFEAEVINQLDDLIEGGRGDIEYKDSFHKILSDKCQLHKDHKFMIPGLYFVDLITRLLERLLDYRWVNIDDNADNRMSCIVNLLNFYEEIKRPEMVIRYLYKLHDLHIANDNYIEAAYTLLKHAKNLEWSEKELSGPDKRNNAYAETESQLKERIYYDSITLLDKGHLWEEAIRLCMELSDQYRVKMYDYIQLSLLLQKQSSFYDNIINKQRGKPTYFKVGFFGMSYPTFLRNKIFIYRGRPYEMLSEFVSRLLVQFPKAQKLRSSVLPGDDVTNASAFYIQVCTVQPIAEEMSPPGVHSNIAEYYHCNGVKRFVYDRPFHQGDKDPNNEFASLWLDRSTFVTAHKFPGILRCFEVLSSSSVNISPLGKAVEDLTDANSDLMSFIQLHESDSKAPINPLSMKLNGVIDAAVMGGITNYEKVFFNDTYLLKNPDNKEQVDLLKSLISKQIPILEVCLKLHGEKVKSSDISLRPLHEKLEIQFKQLKKNVEQTCGNLPGCGITSPRLPMSVLRFHAARTSADASRASGYHSSMTSSQESGGESVRESHEINQRASRSDMLDVYPTMRTSGESLTSLTDKPRMEPSRSHPVVLRAIELTQTLHPTRPARPTSRGSQFSLNSSRESLDSKVEVPLAKNHNEFRSMENLSADVQEPDRLPPIVPPKRKQSLTPLTPISVPPSPPLRATTVSGGTRYSFQPSSGANPPPVPRKKNIRKSMASSQMNAATLGSRILSTTDESPSRLDDTHL